MHSIEHYYTCDQDNGGKMDEESDDEQSEPAPRSETDTCLSSNELEWLNSRSLNTSDFFKEKCSASPYVKRSSDFEKRNNGNLTCPSRSNFTSEKVMFAACSSRHFVSDYHISKLSSTCPSCGEHGCCDFSPAQSSWYCPPPSSMQLVPLCCHHDGCGITSAQMIPYLEDVCEESVCSRYCSCVSPACQFASMLDTPPFLQHTSSSCRKEPPTQRSSPDIQPLSCQARSTRSSREKSDPYILIPHHSDKEQVSPQILPLSPRSLLKRNKDSVDNDSENNTPQVLHLENDKRSLNLQHNDYEESTQKILQLENEKKSLNLQVSVLTCQVEAQSDKIIELESMLSEMKEQLQHSERRLRHELLTRSAIESNKSLLLSQVSNLKVKLTNAEKEIKTSDEKCQKIEKDTLVLKSVLAEKETELLVLKNSVSQSETLTAGNMLQDNCIEGEVSSNFAFMQESELSESTVNEGMEVSQSACSCGTIPRQISMPVSAQCLKKRACPEITSLQANVKNLPKALSSASTAQNDSVRSKTLEDEGVPLEESHLTQNTNADVTTALEKPVRLFTAKTRSILRNSVSSPSFMKFDKERSKGVFRLLKKWKQSTSDNVGNVERSFKRQEMKVTAGPSSDWSQNAFPQASTPFSQWNNNLIFEWLSKIGLNMYINKYKKWGRNEEEILNATSEQLEKIPRDAHFSKKRKNKRLDEECEMYVCPLVVSSRERICMKSEGTKLTVRRNSDPSPQEQITLNIQPSLYGEAVFNDSEITHA